MTLKTIFLFFLIPLSILGQSDTERTLYIIDSIPAFNGFNKIEGEDIKETDIFSVNRVTDPLKLHEFREYNISSIIYLTTNEYSKRADSIKEIPSMKQMVLLNDRWCLKSQKEPYSGNYIDYYLNGLKQGEGSILNGRLNGENLRFFKNGTVSREIHYDSGKYVETEKTFFKNGQLESIKESENGQLEGIWEIYYPNGAVKQKSIFKAGKIDGKSKSFSSKGILIMEKTYRAGIPIITKSENQLSKLYGEGYELFRSGKFQSSIKKFDKIISINNLNADAYLTRAKAKIGLSKFAEAHLDLEKAIEIEPFLLEARLERAFLRMRILESTSDKKTISKDELNLICEDLEFFDSFANYKNIRAKKAITEYCE